MASKAAIFSCWRLLSGAGINHPPAWKGMDLNTEAVVAWESVLYDVLDEDLGKATIAYLRIDNAKYWPSPGQLIQLIPQNQLSGLNTADEAWGLVCKAARQKGSLELRKKPMLIDDEQENQCIWRAIDAVGGIHVICMSEEIDDAAIRAHFCAAYSTHKKRIKIEKEDLCISSLLGKTKLLSNTDSKPFSFLLGG